MLFLTNYIFSLPEELWIYILRNVSSQDALNVFREFPHISEAVQAYKAHLLFGKVVPFLCDWANSKEKDTPGPGLLTLADILSCRLVCKSWSSELDLMFTSHNQYKPGSEFNLTSSGWADSLEIQIKNSTQFTEFSKQFANSPRNPFPSRTFNLDFAMLWDTDPDPSNDTEQAAIDQYWKFLIDFLQTFGKHIWHLKLAPGINQEESIEVNGAPLLQNFSKCLRLLPNLKFLVLFPFWEKWLLNPNDVVAPPLGPLNLESVVLIVPDQDALFYDWFLRGFSQSLRALQIYEVGCSSIPEPFTFPVLVRLGVVEANSPEIVQRIGKWVIPNLRKLDFSFYNVSNLKPEVIQALENFPNRELYQLNSDKDDFVSLTYQVD